MSAKIRVTLGRGKRGILLEKLGKIAQDTIKFLHDLGTDLDIPAAERWVADNFSSTHSLVFELSPQADSDLWKRGLKSVMARDFSDEIMNIRISPRTRQEYAEIANDLEADEKIEFALLDGATEEPEIYELDRSVITQFASEKPPFYRYPGGIQGIVHSFVKEVKRPKLVVRELSTRELVDCYFTKDMYQGAVALLHDEDAIISVEGIVTEDSSTGVVTEMEVTEFTPAPEFDLEAFERMIGAFPKALTGGRDSAALLDEYRKDER
jgi:hypothetical protein